MDLAEKKILESYDCVQIDASLPAKGLYLKCGYKATAYNVIETDNGDYLCYDVMRLEKQTVREAEKYTDQESGEIY